MGFKDIVEQGKNGFSVSIENSDSRDEFFRMISNLLIDSEKLKTYKRIPRSYQDTLRQATINGKHK